jgi:hypothetical protein
MFRSAVLLTCAAALAPAGLAQTRLEGTDIANRPFSADFAHGGSLRLHVRSGEVQIIGTAEPRVSVRLSGRNAQDARNLKVRIDRKGSAANMRISGGPRSELTITIRIPSDTDLYARIPFGEVQVRNIIGNQDVELHAGDLSIEAGDPSEYSHVDASVTSGGLEAPPFHESHGGLFRSFRTTGTGQHRLHAHVGAGQLVLRSRPPAGSV